MILPVFNERKSLPIVLMEWDAMFRANKIPYNFVICEDGSTDGTKEILPGLVKKYPVKLNQAPYRRGYGPAIIDGLDDVSADYLLCIDSDGQCDPADFLKLWRQRKSAGIVIGRRVKRKDNLLRQFFTGSFYCAFWLLFQGKVRDPSSCFLLAETSVLKRNIKYLSLMLEGFRWAVVAVCIKKKIRILEFPINHRQRIAGASRVYHFRTLPGLVCRNFIGLLKIRFISDYTYSE